MVRGRQKAQRGGSIMPMLLISLTALAGFLALAVDVGIIMVARNQCQNAADAAATAGTRLLNGDSTTNFNSANASAAAIAAAKANSILAQPILDNQVTVQVGSYPYVDAQKKFVIKIPAGANEYLGLEKVTVAYTGSTAFAQVLGIGQFTVSASATAVHRPRDIALILDYSGSMRFGSLLGIPFNGARSGSNNPESVFPVFGHYSAQSVAGLQNTASTYDGDGNAFDPCNFTEADSYNNNAPAIVGDFYQSTSPTAVPALAPAASNYASVPGGDQYPHSNFDNGSTWATNVKDFLNGSTDRNATFEVGGYDAYRAEQTFKGYSQGPSYWGKTFFLWPPDPRNTWDWRQKFFIDAGTNSALTLNGKLYDAQGHWLAPNPTTYKINYQAILAWLTKTPNPFPAQLRAGRILYYSAMPTTTDPNLNSRFWTQFPLVDLNERFWKDYVDYVLGLRQVDASTWQVITPKSGYGDDFSWGTTQINTGFNHSVDGRYMDYTDNPLRPRLHFWFGPMTMIDFLSNYNLWYDVSPNATQYCWMPGTAHEVPLYACKLGIQAALKDIKSNHPNDYLSVIMFSMPRRSANDPYGGRFNRVNNPLGQNYSRMIDSLWFPPYTLDNPGTEIVLYDYQNQSAVPRAQGGTCYAMGLMLAYNQFSGNTTLQTYNPAPAPVGDAGGLGRKGAQKFIILETDGLPNTAATADFTNAGSYNSYYKIRYNSSTEAASDFPSVSTVSNNDPTVTAQIYNIATQICASDNASSPGYSTKTKPVRIHCIAFGPVFRTGSSAAAAGLATLQQIQYIGNTQASPTDPLPAYKIIVGTSTQMQSNLRTAIKTILEQDGISVALIQ